MVTGCGTGCGRIFAIIMKDATEDDIGESYLEDRMWPCVTSAMFQIWNTEDHHTIMLNFSHFVKTLAVELEQVYIPPPFSKGIRRERKTSIFSWGVRIFLKNTVRVGPLPPFGYMTVLL